MSQDAFGAAFPEPLRSRLQRIVELGSGGLLTDTTTPEARVALGDAEVLVTGWGCPPLDAGTLDHAPSLRAIVHTAGSVKAFLDASVFDREIRISSAAEANAVPVAEFTFAVIVLARKRAFRHAYGYRAVRRRPDLELAGGYGTRGVVIGVVGASRIGRRVLGLLEALDATVLLHDPYLDQATAGDLGVELVGLDELMSRSEVVTLHAPAIPETRHLIDRRRLGLLPDGAILVNTARGSLVDHDALIDELTTGRIDAVLDVTDPEPLPPESPLYDLPNVFLTPHLAGALGNEVARLGESALDELDRYAAGAPFAYPIRAEEFHRIA
ncbi:MAG: hydroxyacid dehydrogenase [Micromonosporaceae bacterium]